MIANQHDTIIHILADCNNHCTKINKPLYDIDH